MSSTLFKVDKENGSWTRARGNKCREEKWGLPPDDSDRPRRGVGLARAGGLTGGKDKRGGTCCGTVTGDVDYVGLNDGQKASENEGVGVGG